MAEVSTLTPSPPALGDPHAAPSIPLPSTVAPGANSPAPEPSKEMPIPKSSLYNNPALMGATAPPPAKNSTLVSQTPTHGPPPTHSNSSSVPEEVAAENPGAPLLDGAAPQSQEGTGNDTERGVDPGQACEQESNDQSAAADLLNATPEGLVQSTQQAPLTPDMNPLPNLYPDVHVTHIPDPAPEDAPFTEAQPSDPAASDPAPAASDPAPAASDPAPAASDPAPAATDPAQTPPPPTTTAVAEENSPQSPPPQQQAPNPQPQPPARSLKPATPVGVRKAELPSSTPSSPVPVINEPASSSSNLFLPNPNARPAPDTMSYLESASLMSGTLESLSGLEDGSSIGSDSEISGMTVRRTDKYGFLGGNQYSEGGLPLSEKDIRLEVARQREMKWLDMFNNWDKWIKHRFQKVKLRCRKGIPSSLRSKAWQLLSNSKELLDTNPGKFEELEREPGEAKWLDIIEKDLHRQFPFHEMFAARGGHGQQDLYRILKAYTVYRPDEGYCQAQAPVAAVLLMHMPAEQAFWCLVQICEKYLPGYYSAGLEAIQLDGEIFFSLLRRTCPMAYRHLKKFKIDPILYMTEWFMCVFSRTLPWACVLRVWDMFFCEGVKIVFRVGLVLLKQMLGSVDKLRELQGMYETMERLRSISPDTIKEDILVQEIIAIPVTEALIERECSIQVRKWRESRGELTHQPGRRLHGTRAIHEYKRRASAISSGGSFFSLSSSIPPPGPLRASSSLLSLPGFRRSKTPFRSDKKGSFSGPSGMAGLPPQPPPSSISNQAQSTKPPMSGAAPRAPAPHVQSPLVGSGSSTSPGPAQVSEATAIQGQPSAPAPNQNTPPSTLLPPPKVVSEQFTTTLPSPTANNTPLPPANNAPLLPANNAPLPLANNAPLPPANNAPLPPAKKALLPPANKAPLPPCSDGLKEVATAGGEEEGKKKKKSKEDKKKEREDDKQKLKEKKEKEKAEKERIKKDRERMEKDKKKEKGGKKKDKGGGGEAGEKNGAAAARDLV